MKEYKYGLMCDGGICAKSMTLENITKEMYRRMKHVNRNGKYEIVRLGKDNKPEQFQEGEE